MSIVSVIVLLGVLIFAHELGHFLMAKRAGVGVLKFSLGFGPRILGRKIGETEYLLYLIPLGGSNAVGAVGYVAAMREFVEQCSTAGLRFDAIVFATSSGGTQAGIVVGA
ncbi:MAG: site-2 protease family protein, partial [Thermodesulfobacteriota bacterium]